MDVAELILRAADGDQSAMELLDSHCREILTKFFWRKGVDDETVEDLCQMTLLKLWLRAGLFDPAKCGNPVSWVLSIGHRVFIDHCRKEKRTRRLSQVAVDLECLVSSDRVLTTVDHSEVRTVVSKIVSARLSFSDEVVSDWFDGLSSSEAASRRSIPASTSRWRRSQMIEALETSKEFANAFC
jgi:RNA polymerase sigma factor (sigma-70 family)